MPRRRKPILAIVPALLVAAGCASNTSRPPALGPSTPSGSGAPVLLPDPNPGRSPVPLSGPASLDALLPSKLRVHPLTRFALNSAGELELVCHVELLDRFDQAVKGLGVLRLELYRPGEESRSATPMQEAVWTIDLRSPDDNAQAYDGLVTRTYVTRLAQIPASIRAWLGVAKPGASVWAADRTVPGGSAEGASIPSGGWLTLKAYFTVTDSSGRQHVLQASHRLQR